MLKFKKITTLLLVFISLIILCSCTTSMSDSKRFAKEYDISKDNPFEYKNADEIIKILENGTGVVYIGFSSCEWCKKYISILNDVIKDNEFDNVRFYYYDIKKDRQNNTPEYKKIISILDCEIKDYDDEGNKRIYVPTLVVVNKGEIVGYDNTTAYDTKGYENPEIFWKNEDLDNFKNKIKEYIECIDKKVCVTACSV